MLTDTWYEVVTDQNIEELEKKMFDLMQYNEVYEFLGFSYDGELYCQAILRQKGFTR